MRGFLGCVFCLTLLIVGSVSSQSTPPVKTGPALGGEEKDDAIVQAEQTLAAVGLANDGPALLEFFRHRAQQKPNWDELKALVRKLGDDSIEVRGRTSAALVARGPIVIPLLRQAVNDLDDPEIAIRAKRCLRLIEGSSLPAAAARLLAARKPAGAAKALLAYLPFADDAAVIEQVGKALTAVAYPQGKADPDLILALKDQVSVRRAYAGEALCRKDHPEQFPEVRKLLQDAKPTVRLKAAFALAKEQDVEAIPILIDLLAEMPPDQRKPIEDILTDLAGDWTPNIKLAGDDDVSRYIRRDIWASWWKHTNGPALLAEFRKQTLRPAELEKVLGLIEQLGDDAFKVREQAVADLVAYGSIVVPMLREAVKRSELERRMRAERCLRTIAKSESRSLPVAAARLLAVRKSEGAAETLLAFLPWTEDEPLIAEIHTTLAALAVRDGKADAALIRGLDDKLPMRRIAAGTALAKGGGPNHWPTARKLLADKDKTVRMRVALALAAAKDKEAIPFLIDALADVPGEHREQAQEALFMLAGEKSPQVAPGEDAASRKKYRDAWADWWKENGASVDLAKLTPVQGYLGYTLLAGNTRVIELGRDNKIRWKIDGLQYPIDAQVISGNRVLIVEQNGSKVTERDFKGNILWQKAGLPSQPYTAQRMPNGNTFIGMVNHLWEVNRNGDVVFTHNLNGGLNGAFKAPSGEIFCLMQDRVVRLDSKGKEIKSFRPDFGVGGYGGYDLSPNGRVMVIRDFGSRSAVLYDAEGKFMYKVQSPGITAATWLPNGNVLVSHFEGRKAWELDRAGRIVWEYGDGGNYFRARRR